MAGYQSGSIPFIPVVQVNCVGEGVSRFIVNRDSTLRHACIAETWQMGGIRTDESIALDGRDVSSCTATRRQMGNHAHGIHFFWRNFKCQPCHMFLTTAFTSFSLDVFQLSDTHRVRPRRSSSHVARRHGRQRPGAPTLQPANDRAAGRRGCCAGSIVSTVSAALVTVACNDGGGSSILR